jgi:CubicO group peptidase (beta-lactamase class C family)
VQMDRRAFLIRSGALSVNLAPSGLVQAAAWEVGTAEESGFAADLGEKLEAGIRSGLLRGMHAVLVARAGRLVLERYYDGPDESWGRPLGQIAFGPETLHDLRSVTKSIVGLLYGIALDRGLVPPPEAPLLAQFPEYPDLAADKRRARLTIEHALTMTLGTEWNEQLPYTDPANSEIAMETAPDRFRFILERPLVADAGTRWIYNGGAPALLARLIVKGAGTSLPEFAGEALFEPIGISTFEWAAGRDGVHSAASGLRLTSRDLARIGELVWSNGQWKSRRIVSSAWLEASLRSAIPTGDGLEYGRQWFLGEAPVPAIKAGPQRWIGAFGNGGQRLWIMPAAALTVVIFAGNYNAPDGWIYPSRIWREIVLANLHRI